MKRLVQLQLFVQSHFLHLHASLPVQARMVRHIRTVPREALATHMRRTDAAVCRAAVAVLHPPQGRVSAVQTLRARTTRAARWVGIRCSRCVICLYVCKYVCMLHGESNQVPASPRMTKTMAQSKQPTNQPSHTQTANEQQYKPVHQTSDAQRTSISTPPPLTHKSQRPSAVSRKRPSLIQGQDKVPTTTQHPYCTHPGRHVTT